MPYLTRPELGRATHATAAGAGPAVVLAVDDERAIRELVRRVLTRRGHEVVPAASGEEALRLFASHPRPIRLLLTDVVMPGMSGRELASRIRALEPALPVVYMSGDTSGVIDPGDALPPGIAFLPKPFEAQTLVALVEGAVEWGRRGGRLAARP